MTTSPERARITNQLVIGNLSVDFPPAQSWKPGAMLLSTKGLTPLCYPVSSRQNCF